MSDWSCCNPVGKCERGLGCPAGGACHSMPGCKDTLCPGHPASAKVTKVKRSYPNKAPMLASASGIYIKYLAQAMLVFLLVALFCAAAILMIPRQMPKTDCPRLMGMWNGDPPAHVVIKCKGAAEAKP